MINWIVIKTLLLATTVSFSKVGVGQTIPASAQVGLQLETERRVRETLAPLLNRYCGDSCNIVNVGVDVEEEIADGENMGFENAVSGSQKPRLFVKKIAVNLQIDGKVDAINKERLEKIIMVNLRPLGLKSEIDWSPVTVPRIGVMGGVDALKKVLERRISRVIGQVVETYCPQLCIVENFDIEGVPISLDEAEALPDSQKVVDRGSGGVFRIDNIDVNLSMDENLEEDARTRILDVMRARTRFVAPINFNNTVRAFPETYEKKREREKQLAEDPYGLEKLRRMLVMFRDLAGTKEIISKTESTKVDQSKNTTQETSQTSNESKLQSDSTNESFSLEEIALYGAALIVLLGLVALSLMRFGKAKADANELLLDSSQRNTSEDDGAVESIENNEEKKTSISTRLQVQELKAELIDLFMENPKVAKETFTRILKEDGVEATSKYVSIFGHLIIFELLDDPNIQRDLYELSEYYHTSEFKFTPEEEFDLLQKLKTRCTASEIRVLTRKASEKFEFLNKLDPGQIYKLISEENIQVQTIVLTQLDRKRRRALFDMYTGQSKVDLMQQLSLAEAIPKEFLFNVAKALNRKVSSRPEFDTENLRTNDILLDLLEKADLEDQRQLMSQLQETNPDTARSVKLNLVTVEIMPYLKDGHLLELILGMDREDLLTFLMGTREHIRDLLLRKAPEELADSWIEDMEAMASVDENSYRVAEMKVLARIRGLANNGVINLLEINDMIFDVPANTAFSTDSVDTAPLNPASMSAA